MCSWAQLRSLLTAIASWLAAFGLFILIRHTGTKSTLEWSTPEEVLPLVHLASAVIYGVTYWLMTIATETTAFRKRPYGQIIAFKATAMVLATIGFILFHQLLAVARSQKGIVEAVETIGQMLVHPATGVFLLYVAVVTLVLGFIRQTAFMVGPRVLLNLMIGKYYRARTEDRIFMFVDMKDSTMHAERLGHEKFFRLIQECFRDLTDSAIKHRVEI